MNFWSLLENLPTEPQPSGYHLSILCSFTIESYYRWLTARCLKIEFIYVQYTNVACNVAKMYESKDLNRVSLC